MLRLRLRVRRPGPGTGRPPGHDGQGPPQELPRHGPIPDPFSGNMTLQEACSVNCYRAGNLEIICPNFRGSGHYPYFFFISALTISWAAPFRSCLIALSAIDPARPPQLFCHETPAIISHVLVLFNLTEAL